MSLIDVAQESFSSVAKRNGWDIAGHNGFMNSYVSATCAMGHKRTVRCDHLMHSWRCPTCEKQKRVDDWNVNLSSVLSADGAVMVGDFVNPKTSVIVRCRNGHEVGDLPSRIVSDGFFCPTCEADAIMRGEKRTMGRRGRCGSLFKNMADKLGLKTIGECRRVNDLVAVSCRNGHVLRTSIERMRKTQDIGVCTECRNMELYERQRSEFNDIMKANGAEVIGEFRNAKDGVKIKCSNGHLFEADLYHLRCYGFQCGTCQCMDRGNKQYTFQRGHGKDVFLAKIKEMGGIIKGEYSTSQVEMDVECANGHTFRTSLSRMTSTGRWCPSCYRNTRLAPLKGKFIDIVKGKSWSLTSEYNGSCALVTIKCDVGHIFTRKPNDLIKHPHRECPECREIAKRKDGAKRFGDVVIKRGGTVIGEYVDAKTKVKVACEMGHEFNVDWGHMHGQGTWCPECSCSVFETKVIMCCRHLTGLLLSDDRRPEWLSGKKSLDAYDAMAKVAIEADGVQHAAVFNPFERNSLPNHQKILDSMKDSECEGAGVSLLRVPYMLESDDDVFLAHVKHHAMLVGEWNRLIIAHGDHGAIDLGSAYRTRSEELRLLERVLADKHPAAKILTQYRFLTGDIKVFCGVEGHAPIDTTASYIMRDVQWCRICAYGAISDRNFNAWMEKEVMPWSIKHGATVIDNDKNGRKRDRTLTVVCIAGHERVITVGGLSHCIRNDIIPCAQCREADRIRVMNEKWPQFVVSRSISNGDEWRFECRKNSTHVFHGTTRTLEIQYGRKGFNDDLGTPCPECQGFVSARIATVTNVTYVDPVDRIRVMNEKWPQFVVSRSISNDAEWRFECRKNSAHVFHGTTRTLEAQYDRKGFNDDLGTPCPECQGFVSARIATVAHGSDVNQVAKDIVVYQKNPHFHPRLHREHEVLSLIQRVYPNASILSYNGLYRDGTYSCGVAGHDPVTTMLQYVGDKKPGSLCRMCHPSVSHGRWDVKRANTIAVDNALEIGAPTESARCLTPDGEVSARGAATWTCGVLGHKPFLASPDNLRRRKGKAGGWCSECWLARCRALGIKMKKGLKRKTLMIPTKDDQSVA